MRAIPLLLVLAACSSPMGPGGLPPDTVPDDRRPVAVFVDAEQQWINGHTILHAVIGNDGDQVGGFRIRAWVSDGDSVWLGRETTPQALPLVGTTEINTNVWGAAEVEIAKVTLWSYLAPGPWVQTDSILAGEIRKGNG